MLRAVGLAIAAIAALVSFWMYRTRSDLTFVVFAFGVLCAFEAYDPDFLTGITRSGLDTRRIAWAEAHPVGPRTYWLPLSASLIIGSIASPITGTWVFIGYLAAGLATLFVWAVIALNPLGDQLLALPRTQLGDRLMRRLGSHPLGASARGLVIGACGAALVFGIRRAWPRSIGDWTVPLAILSGCIWLSLASWAGSLGEYARTGKLELGGGFLPTEGDDRSS